MSCQVLPATVEVSPKLQSVGMVKMIIWVGSAIVKRNRILKVNGVRSKYLPCWMSLLNQSERHVQSGHSSINR